RAGIRRVFPGGYVRRGGEVGQGEVPDPAVAHHPGRAPGGLSPRGHGAMNGFVDGNLRALLRVPVSASRDGERTDLVVWIDTAFNGGLAVPRKQVAELGLSKQSSAEAILADGRSVELETCACFLDWFGNTYETQIAASDGEYPLLGTMLLDGHRLHINYAAKRSNSRSGP